jgi:hypothetical protein
MSMLGASRFTAFLASVAISGMAGTFWWALETRSDLKAAAGSRAASRVLPPKLTGRASRSKEERSGKFEPNKFELMGKIDRPQPSRQLNLQSDSSGGTEVQYQATDRSIPAALLANYPNPRPASRPLSQNSFSHGSGSPSGRADMPLPALPDMAARPEPAPLQAKAPDPPILLPPLPAPPSPAENPKRQAREPKPAATRPSKPPAPSFYTEKFIEQGEYHYRRRVCEPPNMPDVCFMPQADRQPIVVAKP